MKVISPFLPKETILQSLRSTLHEPHYHTVLVGTYRAVCAPPIDLLQEGVAIILRVTRDDSWLAKTIANAYNRLTLGCLVSIVRDFWTCQ